MTPRKRPGLEGFVLAPAQRRLVDRERAQPGWRARSQVRLRTEAVVDLGRLEAAARSVIDAHEVLRSRLVQGVDGELLQQVVGGRVAVETVETADLGALGARERARPDGALPRIVVAGDGGGSCVTLTLPGWVVDRDGLMATLDAIAAAYGGEAVAAPAAQVADVAGFLDQVLDEETASEAIGDVAMPDWLPASDAREVPLRARRELGATPTLEAMITSLRLVIASWSGTDTPTVGLEHAGRGYEELVGAVGTFAKTVPVALELFGDTFAAQVKAANGLLSELDDRAEGFAPAASPPSVTFSFEDRRTPPSAARQGLAVDDVFVQLDEGALHVVCAIGDGGAVVEVRSTAVDERWVCGLAEALGAVLDQVAATPNAEIDAVAVPSPPGADEPALIDELIASVARASPEACAVVTADDSLTYGELLTTAERLAGRLVASGVGPGDRVALCLDRTPSMIVALLGVLRAGAGYVPLDPRYPVDRIQFMLDDAQVSAVVVDETWPASLTTNAPVLRVDGEGEQAPLPDKRGPRDLAYVIYTSGSTGRPKGVEIEHGALVSSTRARHEVYDAPRRFLLLSSYAFDSSVAGLFWTLTTGGALVLPPPGAERDPAVVAGLVAQHGVDTMLGLPSQHALLFEGADRLGSLRQVIVAGESCPPGLLTRHFDALEDTALFNEYGPTEGTVWATVHRCTGDDAAGTVPIGKAIPGAIVTVVDDALREVTDGEVGEIVIGGAGVARGYLFRPDLTAERFLDDDGVHGRRVRTRDLARRRPDGALEFCGRADSQVKLRGFRIELEEIERALEGLEGVDAAAVTLSSDRGDALTDERLLLGFVTAVGGATLDVEELRRGLGERLPGYMVPARLTVVASFPLSANGKVDREALRSLDVTASSPTPSDAPSAAPARGVERAIAAIWQAALKRAAIGLDDDFFELGGHSLLAIKVVTQINSTLEADLELGVLFEAPTIRALAARIGTRSDVAGSVVSLKPPVDGAPVVFCVGGVNQYRTFAAALPDPWGAAGVFVAPEVEIMGGEDTEVTVESLARDYVSAMRDRQPQGPYVLLGLSFGGLIAYEMARQLVAAGDQVPSLVLVDVWLPRGLYRRTASFVTRAARRILSNPKAAVARAREVMEMRSHARGSKKGAADLYDGVLDLHQLGMLRAAAYQAARERYDAVDHRYDGDLIFVRAEQDTPPLGQDADECMGWTTLVDGGVFRYGFDTGHVEVLQEPMVDAVIAKIARHFPER